MTAFSDQTARRLAPFGESVFTTMSRLAVEHKAVNLGQGFPDFDGPDFVKDAAKRAMDAGIGQYARAFGLPATNAAVARYCKTFTRLGVDPETEVTVTAGCTEAIASTLLGLLNPGDEVVLLDPSYDSYGACVAMAGGIARRVALQGPAFRIDEPSLRAAFSPRTRAILFNSPHNPTGRMFDVGERRIVASLAREFGAIVISDEVYDQITYSHAHESIVHEQGMRERTVVLGSLGKTFSLTGWKVGWAVAPPAITRAIRSAHQFLTFCAPSPLQAAAADALNAICTDDRYLVELRRAYLERRDMLLGILEKAGFVCVAPEGSYFILADAIGAGFPDDLTAAKCLVRAGVAAIPASSFYDAACPDRRWLRFAFCKRIDTLAAARDRLLATTLMALAKSAH